MNIIQAPLFDFEAFIAEKDKSRLVMVLDAMSAERLIAALEKEHWTGRKGYSVRGMWSAFIVGVLSDCHSIADTVRLLKSNKEVRLICGFAKDKLPSQDALERFLKKLVENQGLLEECFVGMVETLRKTLPDFGAKLAIDATDIKAYSNGHSSSPSDPDAAWGVKEAKAGPEKEQTGKRKDRYRWFGYKLHLCVDALYELPIAFTLTPANEGDGTQVKSLLERGGLSKPGNRPQAVMADKGYDSKDSCLAIFKEAHAAPIIPLIERPGWESPDICNTKGTPTCGCGLPMVYWGRDGSYLKYRCPDVLGKARCRSRFKCTASKYGYVLKLPVMKEDPRRHVPVPHESKKWARLYRMRTAVERVNSRLKDLLGLRNITLRNIAKVTLRSLLSLLVMLAAALSMVKRHRFKEIRTLVN